MNKAIVTIEAKDFENGISFPKDAHISLHLNSDYFKCTRCDYVLHFRSLKDTHTCPECGGVMKRM